jgi:hypothetical protein
MPGYSDYGEDYIRRGLEKRNWFVIPTGKIQDGGAPLATTCGDALIIPDLQIMAGGKTKWVEVKRKTAPGFSRRDNFETHGFCKRQWDDYKSCQLQAGVEVWLFIWEVKNKKVIHAPIDFLYYTHHRRPGKFKENSKGGYSDFCKHGMVFFRRDDLPEITKEEFDSGTWDDRWMRNR